MLLAVHTSLKATGEEASKGCHETGKGSHDQRMELKGSILKVCNGSTMSVDDLRDG